MKENDKLTLDEKVIANIANEYNNSKQSETSKDVLKKRSITPKKTTGLAIKGAVSHSGEIEEKSIDTSSSSDSENNDAVEYIKFTKAEVISILTIITILLFFALWYLMIVNDQSEEKEVISNSYREIDNFIVKENEKDFFYLANKKNVFFYGTVSLLISVIVFAYFFYNNDDSDIATDNEGKA